MEPKIDEAEEKDENEDEPEVVPEYTNIEDCKEKIENSKFEKNVAELMCINKKNLYINIVILTLVLIFVTDWHEILKFGE